LALNRRIADIAQRICHGTSVCSLTERAPHSNLSDGSAGISSKAIFIVAASSLALRRDL
jgi:hypothetical protein